MTPDEQKTADAQIALCDKRQHMIEAGTIKSCQPLPLPILPRPDDCPNCGGKMNWLVARHGWFCLRTSCQTAMPQPIETFTI